MSKPQTATVAIWISIIGFCLTIGGILRKGGNEQQQLKDLIDLSRDHENRIRMLEQDRLSAARMDERIQQMSRKVDQIYNQLILQPRPGIYQP